MDLKIILTHNFLCRLQIKNRKFLFFEGVECFLNMEIRTRVYVLTDPKKKDKYLELLSENLVCSSFVLFRDKLNAIVEFQKILKQKGNLSPVSILFDRPEIWDWTNIQCMAKKLQTHKWDVCIINISSQTCCPIFILPTFQKVMEY